MKAAGVKKASAFNIRRVLAGRLRVIPCIVALIKSNTPLEDKFHFDVNQWDGGWSLS
jgi:hypothetical protein